MLDQFPDHFVGAAERRMGGFDFAGLILLLPGKAHGLFRVVAQFDFVRP
jgi:hypothetical protein